MKAGVGRVHFKKTSSRSITLRPPAATTEAASATAPAAPAAAAAAAAAASLGYLSTLRLAVADFILQTREKACGLLNGATTPAAVAVGDGVQPRAHLFLLEALLFLCQRRLLLPLARLRSTSPCALGSAVIVLSGDCLRVDSFIGARGTRRNGSNKTRQDKTRRGVWGVWRGGGSPPAACPAPSAPRAIRKRVSC
eukprot:COSAG06_NODE_22249_length_729_cov_2.304762_1_plen_195_part_00